MSLLIPLFITTLLARLAGYLLNKRENFHAKNWNTWSAALSAGMAVVYLCTSITHFIEPQRSGLEAIVPSFLPEPGLVVFLSGIAELALMIGLLIPKTRRLTALGSSVFLIAVFPANIIAAAGVDHPAAPQTPLIPRLILQLILIAVSLIIFFKSANSQEITTHSGSVKKYYKKITPAKT